MQGPASGEGTAHPQCGLPPVSLSVHAVAYVVRGLFVSCLKDHAVHFLCCARAVLSGIGLCNAWMTCMQSTPCVVHRRH